MQDTNSKQLVFTSDKDFHTMIKLITTQRMPLSSYLSINLNLMLDQLMYLVLIVKVTTLDFLMMSRYTQYLQSKIVNISTC